jgi:hypothetical protein
MSANARSTTFRRLVGACLLAAGGAATAELGGCNDAQTGALLGGGAGAGLGAIIGHQSGHGGEGAAIGAGAGLLAGYIIGNESDKSKQQSLYSGHPY